MGLGSEMNLQALGCYFCFVFVFFFFFAVLGLELRTYTLSHSTAPFMMVFFEVGSRRLFAQAGLEL
jgi:hypothetical protein